MVFSSPLRVTIAKKLTDNGVSFPDDNCVPAEEAELDAFLYVALFVAFYLLLPELAIALWRYVVPAAFVSVPKTTVDKSRFAVSIMCTANGHA